MGLTAPGAKCFSFVPYCDKKKKKHAGREGKGKCCIPVPAYVVSLKGLQGVGLQPKTPADRLL
eukprot:scaffold299738_cov19-Tisochrysis_lutea.AAC.1